MTEVESRLLQVFLGNHGAYEVHVTTDEGKRFGCNCPGFTTRRRCKHVDYVKQRWSESNGYIVPMSADTPIPSAEDIATREAWRQFVLKHAPVVVL